MPDRPTLRDIARKAGCHHTTISLALRRHPSIPQATADRIARLAEKMGYRPNPLLSAWMADVRLRGSGHYRATLAYLDAEKNPQSHMMDYFYGASRRADELGYKLSYFWLHEPGMTAQRMSRILHNSGIRGVVIGPISPRSHVSLTWGALAAVAIGHSLLRPRLSRVAHDQFHGLQTAIRAVTKQGYRRIGMVWSQNLDSRTNYNYSSLMARHHQTISPRDRVPICYVYDDGPLLSRWFTRWRPDCVMGVTYGISHLREAVGPEPSFGIVDLDLGAASIKGSAGIDQQYEQIGTVAVEMVCANLSINRLGIPDEPLVVLSAGRWVNGSTLPKRTRDE